MFRVRGLVLGVLCLVAVGIDAGAAEALALPSPLRVTSPNGAESYRVGDRVVVRWEADPQVTTDVVVLFSADAGSSWVNLTSGKGVGSDGPDWGEFGWTIPDRLPGHVGPVSSACLIRVYDSSNTAVEDVSDAVFTIAGPSALQPKTPRQVRGLSPETIINTQSPGTFSVAIPPGREYSVSVVSLSGEVLDTRGGYGPIEYQYARGALTLGMYLVKVHIGTERHSRIVVIAD